MFVILVWNLIRTFVYVLYEVMSGIHFDDGELQRRAVGVVKKKKTKVNL